MNTAAVLVAGLEREGVETLDVVKLFAPVTKWNARIFDSGIVHESVRKAFKTAEFEKPGATHLELPVDVSPDPRAGDPFTVRNVLPILREVMVSDDVLLSDVGSHKMAIAQNFPTYEPNTCIVSNGLASMGISVPGGLAADLAVDSNVVAATGDGGFMMNAAEIETATRVGCGYTILLFRDDEYGLITEEQVEHRGEHFGTELANPDFQTFAESFGIEAYRPDDWQELKDALETAVPSGEVSLVEVVLD